MASKRGEIRAGTQASFQFLRLPVRLEERQGQTHHRTLADLTKQNTGDFIKPTMLGPESNVPDQTTNCHRKAGTFGQVTYETHTVASQEQLEGTRNVGEKHSHSKITPPTSRVVAGGKQCYHRSTSTPASTCAANLYKRIKRRVGRPLKRAYGNRKLVTPRKQTTHKLPRVKSSSSGLKGVPSSLYKQSCSYSYRQHLCGSIHKQGRGNEVGASVCSTLEDPHLVHQKPGNPQSPIYPWSSECDSRQVIQTGSNHPNRVVPQSGDIPSNMQPVAHPPSGSFCHKVQQQAPTFCLTGPRPPGLGSRCPQPVLGGTGPLRLPTSSHLGQSGGEVTGLPVQQDHSDCPGWPNMPWFWDLVTMSSQIPLCLPNRPDLVSQPFNQVLHKNLSNLNVHAWLLEPQQSRSRASLRQWQKIEAPQRRSTRSVYEAKWTIFTKWCLSNQVDFRAPPLKAIADFLLHLFQDRKLQPGTIDGYRSAIADKLCNVPTNVSKEGKEGYTLLEPVPGFTPVDQGTF